MMRLTAPRYTNETLGPCNTNCSAHQIDFHYYWASQKVTATLTAATVVLVVDQQRRTTKTETVYNDLPAGVTPPPTNAKGTHTASINIATAFGKSTVVELYASQPFAEAVIANNESAYPTGFIQYPVNYAWFGTLPTIDAFGASICSTVTTLQEVAFSAYSTPAQAKPTSTDHDDPLGHVYKVQSYPCYGQVDASINTQNAAAELCIPVMMCGVSVVNTVKFLTETSIKYENGNSEATPTDSTPKKGSATEAPQSPTKTNDTPLDEPTPKNTGSSQVVPPPPISLSIGGPAVTIGSGSSKTAVILTSNQAGETIAVYSGQDATVTSTVAGDIGVLIAAGLGVTGKDDPAQFTGNAVDEASARSCAIASAILLLGLLLIV